MKLKHVWIVFKKEVRDIIRDKRTIITSILVPMILIPVMNMLLGGNAERLNRDIIENITIALSEPSNTEEIKNIVKNEIIKDYPNISLIEVDNPTQAISESKVRVVLDFEADYSAKLNEGKPFVIKLIYDKSQTKSEGSLGFVWEAIDSFNRKIVEKRLDSYGISKNVLTPVVIEESNIASEGESAGSLLALIFPILIVVLMSSGGVAPATDLVAGEKERNTLEPLLTTKPGRSSLLVGKYLTVTLFSFITVITTMVGVILGYILNPSSFSMGSSTGITGVSIPPLAFILVIIISMALGMTFSALQIALSTYAKSFKEAQTYLSFLMIVVMIPGYATIFMQPKEIPVYMFFVPVLNTLSALKTVFGYSINYTYLFITLGSSIVYVIISLWLTSSLFKKEKYLFRS